MIKFGTAFRFGKIHIQLSARLDTGKTPSRCQLRIDTLGVPVDALAVHFHDNRGTALVNAYAAFRAGIRHFDAASGGVGGCPFAPGAAGNLATEDLVYMLHAIGEKTTIDLERSCVAAEFLEASLGHELPGRYHGFARSLKALEVKRNHA